MEPMANPSGRHGPKRRRHGQGTIFERHDKPRLRPFTGVLSVGKASGKRRRLWFQGVSRRDVERQMSAVRAKLTAGASPASLDTSVAEYLAGWLDRQRDTLRPSSWERYEIVVRRRIIPTLGAIPLFDLAVEHIRQARSSWGGPAMTGGTLRILRAALADAEADGLVVRNMARLVDPPRVEPREQVVIGPDEMRAILAACRGDWLYPIVAVAGLCGLRRGEVLGLRRRDLEAGTLSVRGQVRHVPLTFRAEGALPYQLVPPKTAAGRRTIVVPATVAAALTAHLARLDAVRTRIVPRDDLIFATTAGKPINPNRVTKRFAVLLERSGIPHVRFHDLRHGAATILHASGVGRRTAMEIMGHSSEAQTDDYTGVLPETMRDAAARIERAISG